MDNEKLLGAMIHSIFLFSQNIFLCPCRVFILAEIERTQCRQERYVELRLMTKN